MKQAIILTAQHSTAQHSTAQHSDKAMLVSCFHNLTNNNSKNTSIKYNLIDIGVLFQVEGDGYG